MWVGLPRGERERALRGIGERLVAEDVAVREAAECLFLQVAAGEPALVKALRGEWTKEGSLSGLLKAATTFAHEDEIALVESEDSVVGILRGASALGPEAFDSVRRRLRARAGTWGMWVDSSGPSEDERLLIERADGLAVKYGEGTEVGRFYKDLADRTRALIAHRTRHMEERDLDD
jgi:hypothetical protein